MNIKNWMIFSGLLALLAASASMTGCSHDEPQADYDAIASPPVVIKGEGSGVYTDIAISAASMFGFDSAELNDEGKAAIDAYRKTIGPELTEAYLVLIVGHTDSSGDERYNKALSLKRAESVADYLISTGVNADAIRVIGRGSEEPLASNDTLEGRIQNRRVDILVVAEIRDLDTMVFPSAALFERKSAEMNEQGKALLEKNYQEASEQLARAAYIEIVGYTDNVGDDKDNMTLSKKRAASVHDFLIAKGVDASKMVTTGKGAAMPIAGNDTAEGRAQNRRVEILILGRLKDKQ